jgi:hypothetical protein
LPYLNLFRKENFDLSTNPLQKGLSRIIFDP